MQSASRDEPLYSPIPGIIPGEIDVTRPPVAPRDTGAEPKPVRAPSSVRPARIRGRRLRPLRRQR